MINIFIFINIIIQLVKGNGINPVIGIVANSFPEDDNHSNQAVVFNQYVRWLEDGGAIVIPIFTWYNDIQIDQLFMKINGVLWQGGMRNLKIGGEFEDFNKKILGKIININDRGIHFPLWLTCQGFELIHLLLTKDPNCLSKFSAWEYMIPLDFDDEIMKSSVMFSFFDQNDFNNLKYKNTTVHFHNLGVETKIHDNNEILRSIFRITSFGVDRGGNKFIASIEGLKYPFYGVQFHPEEVPYNPELRSNIVFSTESIKISQMLSLKFIDEARKNSNSLPQDEYNKWKVINSLEELPVHKDGDYMYLFNK